MSSSPGDTLSEPERFGPLIGASPAMKALFRAIGLVAPSEASVLITGESGTGKDVVACAIQKFSLRRDQPFLAVNCGAMSPGLIESEMFGHIKGSFTGALRDHRGLFERAHRGTLFLDEVCEMPPELQAKLLRVLEGGTFLPVGADAVRETDVRIVAATNQDPRRAVDSGRLREDLFYRLNVFALQVPALRERREDIALLATHFLSEISGWEGAERHFADRTLAELSRREWPGNVRQLRNAVVRAYVMADGPLITPEDLPPLDGELLALPSSPVADTGRDAQAQDRRPVWNAQPDTGPIRVVFDVGTDLAEIEREVILATLRRFDGHRERTAAALGVSLKTLYNRLREYDAPRARKARGLAGETGGLHNKQEDSP